MKTAWIPGGALGPGRINASTGPYIIEISKSVGGATYIYENEYLIWFQHRRDLVALAHWAPMESLSNRACLQVMMLHLGQCKSAGAGDFEHEIGGLMVYIDHSIIF